MTTDTIPEARHAMMDLASCLSDGRAMSDQAERIINGAITKHFQRRLAECGGNMEDMFDRFWEAYKSAVVTSKFAEARATIRELVQAHTAKAVEDYKRERDDLKQQCEALETALADWHKMADQRSEALIKAQQQCEELRYSLNVPISGGNSK